MANYLNAFYGATNAYCDTMTSATYANEIQGVNMVEMNNKLLGPDGYKYHLSNGKEVWLPSYQVKCTGFDSANSTIYGIGRDGQRLSWHITESQMRQGIVAAKEWDTGYSSHCAYSIVKSVYKSFLEEGFIAPMAKTVSKQGLSNATLSQLVTYEGSRAKANASANSMRIWGNIVQEANTEFSNIKNQAQAGTSQINGWVQTDGDNLAAAANLLSTVLQGLASPVTVS